MHIVPLRAETLTPLAYGSLAVDGGVASISEILGDRALAFALCAAFGMMSSSSVLPQSADYREDLSRMPWRTSLLKARSSHLLPPLAKRSDLGIEGGYQNNFRVAAGTGDFKEFFTIQEIAPGSIYDGALFVEDEAMDPFAIAGCDEVVVRMGNSRTGQVLLTRGAGDMPVRLNAATAWLFGRRLPVDRFYLHNLQASPFMSLEEAAGEVSAWG